MPNVLRKYETDAGAVVRIRLSDAKFALAGGEAAGTLTDNRQRVSASGSRRRFNTIVARGWIYTFSAPISAGLVATSRLFIPRLTPATYTATPTSPIDYKGRSYVFETVQSEG